MAQPVAFVELALIIVANAVAVLVVTIERLDGNTAARSPVAIAGVVTCTTDWKSLPATATNHILPSAPGAMLTGSRLEAGVANSLSVPDVVIRPMKLPLPSVNQIAPSGPAAMPTADWAWAEIVYSVNAPEVVTWPTLLANA